MSSVPGKQTSVRPGSRLRKIDLSGKKCPSQVCVYTYIHSCVPRHRARTHPLYIHIYKSRRGRTRFSRPSTDRENERKPRSSRLRKGLCSPTVRRPALFKTSQFPNFSRGRGAPPPHVGENKMRKFSTSQSQHLAHHFDGTRPVGTRARARPDLPQRNGGIAPGQLPPCTRNNNRRRKGSAEGPSSPYGTRAPTPEIPN